MAELEAERSPVVVIIDSAPDGRRKQMAVAFDGQARVQFAYNTGQRIVLRDRTDKKLDVLEPALVTLRHFRDLPIQRDNPTTITVYFGGNGGNDSAAPANAEYRIWRPVNVGSGCLTSLEAKELLDFAIRIQEKRKENPVPNFLRNPSATSILPALLVLCQGYLAAHSTSEAADIKRALDHMGLPVFFEAGGEDAALLQRVVPLKRAETSSPSWWTNVFGNSRKYLEEQLVRELGVDSLARQPDIKSLIDDIFNPATEELTPLVVAKAYCAIAAKITGKPC